MAKPQEAGGDRRMKEPTQEEIKELWEWCGFVRVPCHRDCVPHWHYPDGKVASLLDGLPPIDLNNLFKYAVPKLQDEGNNVELYAYEHKGYMATVYRDCFSQRGSDGFDPFLEQISQVKNDDPTLALFWAIWKVIHE
jgi:hypothetical protein